MLITDYVVGRDDEGTPLCLVVSDVVPADCLSGRSNLVSKITRHDLIQEFISEPEGTPCEWIKFPDLPDDVVELLRQGQSLKIVDAIDNLEFPLLVSTFEVAEQSHGRKVVRRHR